MNFGVHQCKNCGADYIKIRSGQHACSKKCSAHLWYLENHQPAQIEPITSICLHCGETYIPTRSGKGQKYCSKECRKAADKKPQKIAEKRSGNCNYCGKAFEYDFIGHHVHYCSIACRIKNSRKNGTRKKVSTPGASIRAKCPRCEQFHYISVNYIGTGTPRFFCGPCSRSIYDSDVYNHRSRLCA